MDDLSSLHIAVYVLAALPMLVGIVSIVGNFVMVALNHRAESASSDKWMSLVPIVGPLMVTISWAILRVASGQLPAPAFTLPLSLPVIAWLVDPSIWAIAGSLARPGR